MSKQSWGPVDWARHYAGLRERGQHPLLTAREAREEVDRLGTELYWAQDALAYVGEWCTLVEREHGVQEGAAVVSTGDVRTWLKGPRCARLLAVDASLVPESRPAEDADRIAEDLRGVVRAGLTASGRSQASIARELNVSTKHLHAMLMGHSRLTLWWAARILRVCGMRLVVGEGPS